VNGLRDAFGYFTIVPVGDVDAPDARALVWLPLVGAVVGAVAGGAAYGVARVAPPALALAVAFALPILLTGALHVDGFLDGCDAFFASVPAARRLEILRDPRHGTYALAGGAIAAAFWIAAVSCIAPARLALALACAGASARLGAISLARFVPYGRAGEPAPALRGRPSIIGLTIGLVFVLCVGAAMGVRGAIIVPAALAFAVLAGLFARRQLGGGLTGDAYGFSIVVAEVAGLVAFAV